MSTGASALVVGIIWWAAALRRPTTPATHARWMTGIDVTGKAVSVRGVF